MFLAVRYNRASEYRGAATVVYGHTPVVEPEWLNRTINVDTGCVFGGSLTALRYPEKELVSVRAERTNYEPARPFLSEEAKAPVLSTQHELDDVLDLEDVHAGQLGVVRKVLVAFPVTREDRAGLGDSEGRERPAMARWRLVSAQPTLTDR